MLNTQEIRHPLRGRWQHRKAMSSETRGWLVQGSRATVNTTRIVIGEGLGKRETEQGG